MSRLSRIYRRVRSIPSTLQAITILCWVLGSVVVVCSVTPGWKDDAGYTVSLNQMWSDGSGIFIMFSGIMMLTLGTLIYMGRSWVRHLLMLSVIIIGLSGFLDPEYEDVPIALIIGISLVAIVLGARYFYFRNEVILYFSSPQTNQNKT